jgi:hypothetical protein
MDDLTLEPNPEGYFHWTVEDLGTSAQPRVNRFKLVD